MKECDTIYLLEKGEIIDRGTYQELLKSNQQFRRMANEDEKDIHFSQPDMTGSGIHE